MVHLGLGHSVESDIPGVFSDPVISSGQSTTDIINLQTFLTNLNANSTGSTNLALDIQKLQNFDDSASVAITASLDSLNQLFGQVAQLENSVDTNTNETGLPNFDEILAQINNAIKPITEGLGISPLALGGIALGVILLAK